MTTSIYPWCIEQGKEESLQDFLSLCKLGAFVLDGVEKCWGVVVVLEAALFLPKFLSSRAYQDVVVVGAPSTIADKHRFVLSQSLSQAESLESFV